MSDVPMPPLRDALLQVVAGDVSAVAVIVAADHHDLREAASIAPGRLTLTRAAAVAVLTSLYQGTCTPEEAQAWAEFVRYGYASGAQGPIAPIDIDYEEAWEDDIVEVVGRLDQIGDLIDGEVSRPQMLLLLQLLGVP